MRLRVIYRSYGGENTKGRPEYYSKLLALTSFLRAIEGVEADVVFLNDGPIPADRLRLMQQSGRIVELANVGMRGSYRAALEYPMTASWDPEDVVWFSEDDYLYAPQAFHHLQRAAEALSEVDYFALYASTPAHPAKRDDEPWAHRPSGWRDLPPWDVGGHQWVRIYSTTSTFGARVGALRQDLGLFRFCMVPHRNMLRDHDTGLLLQGFEPYSYRELLRGTFGRPGDRLGTRLRGAALMPFHLATNLRSHRRVDRRRVMVAADPNLATHMETGLMAVGQDWPAVARDTARWGRDNDLVDEAQPTH